MDDDQMDGDQCGKVCTLWDEVPDDLVALIDFALDPAGPDTEFLSPGPRLEDARIFEGRDLTLMISVRPNSDNTVWIDGWIAPGVTTDVELRTAEGSQRRVCADGRFTYESVGRGRAQFSLWSNGLVSTPAVVL